MKGHQRGPQRQAENADIGGKPDPEQLKRVALAFAFGDGLDAAGFQLPGRVPGVRGCHGV